MLASLPLMSWRASRVCNSAFRRATISGGNPAGPAAPGGAGSMLDQIRTLTAMGYLRGHGQGGPWPVEAGGPPPPVLVGIGIDADCENAALSPPDVGDAIPAHAVEGRALSGP